MSQLTKIKGFDRKYLVALGSNGAQDIDGTLKFLQAGLRGLSGIATSPVVASRIFQSEAFPAGSGPDYVNAAAIVQSTLEPAQVLTALHQIEAANGRVRDRRWGQRTLDLDLLACDDLVVPDEGTVRGWMTLPLDDQLRDVPAELLLPHPRLHERAFVLLPLRDIAPNWCHPVLHKTVSEMLDDLPAALQNTVNALAISDSWP